MAFSPSELYGNEGEYCYFWNGSHAILMQRPLLFYQNYHTIEMYAWQYILQFSHSLFFFLPKTNIHLYEGGRLSSFLFTFFLPFSIKISCRNLDAHTCYWLNYWHTLISKDASVFLYTQALHTAGQ